MNISYEPQDLVKDHTSMKEIEIEEVLDFADVLWDSKEKPDQAKFLVQSLLRYQKGILLRYNYNREI